MIKNPLSYKEIINQTFFGSVFSLLAFISFGAVVHLVAWPAERFTRFFDGGNLHIWFGHDFSDVGTGSTTIFFWVLILLLGFLGFVSSVFARVLFGLASDTLKADLQRNKAIKSAQRAAPDVQ